jgi:hypothetical protein
MSLTPEREETGTVDQSGSVPLTIADAFHQSLLKYGQERRAAKAIMNVLPFNTYDQLADEAAKASYVRRRYGTQWYTWAYHPALTQPRDPWPASRYPKDLLCIEIGIGLNLRFENPPTVSLNRVTS